MHTRFPEHDAAISDWMAKQGWPVTERHYDFDREVLAWRAGGQNPTITLRVTLSRCEDVPPHIMTEFFDGAALAQKLASTPDRYTVVMRDAATNNTVIGQLQRAP